MSLKRSYELGRKQVRQILKDRREICLCGLPKKSNHVACLLCWKAAPYQVRCGLRSTHLETRRASTRKMLEIAQSRSNQPLETTTQQP